MNTVMGTYFKRSATLPQMSACVQMAYINWNRQNTDSGMVGATA